MSDAQSDLFAGAEERDEAILRAEIGARGWVDAVGLPALARLARYHNTLQSGHLIDWITRHEKPRPDDRRVYGAVFKRAQSEGWLEPTDVHKPCEIPHVAKANHRRPQRIWEVRHAQLPTPSGD